MEAVKEAPPSSTVNPSREVVIKAARATLHDAMIGGLSGQLSRVPVVVRWASSAQVHVASQPVAEALLDTLDLSVCANELLQVLRHSHCPLVASLKTRIATTFADRNAPDFAEVSR